MGSIGSQNPWSPYDNYKDCSLEICTIYCPQFCYLIFPPPPLDDDSTHFSPLIIAIIGILATAFLLVSYYVIVTRYCKRRSDHPNTALENEANSDHLAHDHMPLGATGLDEALIKRITVCKYRKSEGLIDGTECAVCLSDFRENDPLRLLPKCSHAFHLPCIDTWLKSQSNCPLCRANVIGPGPQTSMGPGFNVDSYEIRRPGDLVLVVDDQVRDCGVVSVVDDDQDGVGGGSNVINESTGTELQSRRSISLSTFSFQSQILISDILKIEEIDEDLNQVVMRRSISTSKLHDHEDKNSSLLN